MRHVRHGVISQANSTNNIVVDAPEGLSVINEEDTQVTLIWYPKDFVLAPTNLSVTNEEETQTTLNWE